jgi:hypothetical protein
MFDRRRFGSWAVTVVAALLLGTVAATSGHADPAPSSAAAIPVGLAGTAASQTVGTARRWLSGATGDHAPDGSFGTWRRSPLQVGGTWDDGDTEQIHMYSICQGGPWGAWTKPLDIAIGAIDVTRGETWAAAARGAYNARWRANLTQIKACWGHRNPANLYIRFAHEMNLGDSDWRVRAGEERAFVQAIARYSALRYAILPQAHIVLCPNDETDLDGLDVRRLWPGRDGQGRLIANVYAVDSYNGYGLVTTTTQFAHRIVSTDENGEPMGIESHRQFAQSKGVPFAVSEWSNNGDPLDAGHGGEAPAYIQAFNAWARAHGGDPAHPRAGQVLYEIQYDVDRQFEFWPLTLQPRTAAAYRALSWGH